MRACATPGPSTDVSERAAGEIAAVSAFAHGAAMCSRKTTALAVRAALY
jgi:hypothetical protein